MSETAAPAATGVTWQDTRMIAVDDIGPGDNVRKTFDANELADLANSIAMHGVIEPVVVWERLVTEGPRYILIAGERRWRAAELAGLTEIPARIAVCDQAVATELGIVENLQRSDLNPIEEAEAFRRLSQLGLTQAQIGARVGRSQPAIANALRLLALPDKTRELVALGHLTPTHATLLLQHIGDHPAAMDVAAQACAAEQITTARLSDHLDYRVGSAIEQANVGRVCDWAIQQTCKADKCEHLRAGMCFGDAACHADRLKAAREKQKAGKGVPTVGDAYQAQRDEENRQRAATRDERRKQNVATMAELQRDLATPHDASAIAMLRRCIARMAVRTISELYSDARKQALTYVSDERLRKALADRQYIDSEAGNAETILAGMDPAEVIALVATVMVAGELETWAQGGMGSAETGRNGSAMLRWLRADHSATNSPDASESANAEPEPAATYTLAPNMLLRSRTHPEIMYRLLRVDTDAGDGIIARCGADGELLPRSEGAPVRLSIEDLYAHCEEARHDD